MSSHLLALYPAVHQFLAGLLVPVMAHGPSLPPPPPPLPPPIGCNHCAINAPEFDPTSLWSALALTAGGLLIFFERLRRGR